MPDFDDEQPDHDPQAAPSKSALKREMLALQELGESLVALSDQQLAQLPVTDERLLQAIRETRAIRSNSARRRHLQFIGKLMRNIDPEPLQRALRSLHQGHKQENELFHRLEQMRDDTLAAGPRGVELVIAQWPQADRQQLRQMVLQHQREVQRRKPPAASRKLFRYLRELQKLYGFGD
jgi:ribosome-associated protein